MLGLEGTPKTLRAASSSLSVSLWGCHVAGIPTCATLTFLIPE